jgi:uracil-DNA glycosylase
MTPDWHHALAEELGSIRHERLLRFVAAERQKCPVFPPEEEVFAAFDLCPFAAVKVVILGQDPYHGPGQAHGLCFSVPRGVPPPPSLKNILKELHDDLGLPPPASGDLSPWTRQGVLLLNTTLTVRQGEAFSHAKQGWEEFSDAVIRSLAQRHAPCAFILWGAPAQKKAKFLDPGRHLVHTSAHPSPLSVYRGFYGSKPFSTVNSWLSARGQIPIDWSLT